MSSFLRKEGLKLECGPRWGRSCCLSSGKATQRRIVHRAGTYLLPRIGASPRPSPHLPSLPPTPHSRDPNSWVEAPLPARICRPSMGSETPGPRTPVAVVARAFSPRGQRPRPPHPRRRVLAPIHSPTAATLVHPVLGGAETRPAVPGGQLRPRGHRPAGFPPALLAEPLSAVPERSQHPKAEPELRLASPAPCAFPRAAREPLGMPRGGARGSSRFSSSPDTRSHARRR